MKHKDLQKLLLKYHHGKCTDEEIDQIHKWFNSLNSESQITLEDEEKERLEEKLLEKIRAGINEDTAPSEPGEKKVNN